MKKTAEFKKTLGEGRTNSTVGEALSWKNRMREDMRRGPIFHA